MLAQTLALTAFAALVAAQEPEAQDVNLGVQLHPNGNPNKCLDIAGANFADGTEVRIFDCNKTPAQNFIVNRGDGKVRVAAHPQFCLDAGENLSNGAKVKIWTCYDGLPQQQWFYTEDNKLQVTNRGLCLDATDGDLGGNGTPSKQTQVWQCASGNTNQVWAVNIPKKRSLRFERD